MAGESTRFLKLVRKAWLTGFPFLKPVEVDEVPRRQKCSNFCCADYAKTRGLFYFVSFDFDRNFRGQFSISITVSQSADRSVLDPSEDCRHPSATNVGTFPIAVFLGRGDFRWQLLDWEGNLNSFIVGLGGPADDYQSPFPKGYHYWQPSSFELPLEAIGQEAIHDINGKLRQFVFPKLEISLPD